MTSGKLWYLKRGEATTGPFPIAVLERNIVLGRVAPDDLVSQDREHWVIVSQAPEFELIAASPPAVRDLGDADERQGERRHAAAGGAAAGSRRTRERRREEPAELIRRRALSTRVWRGLSKRRPDNKMFWVSLASVIVIVVCLGIAGTPERLQPGDCAADPAPGVDWESCSKPAADLRRANLQSAIVRNADLESSDLAGADLSGADLAYADLRQVNFELADLATARLTGANLREANFAHANLRSADLQFADLRSARFDGTELSDAKLGNAIWFNGKRCARGSIGACRFD